MDNQIALYARELVSLYVTKPWFRNWFDRRLTSPSSYLWGIHFRWYIQFIIANSPDQLKIYQNAKDSPNKILESILNYYQTHSAQLQSFQNRTTIQTPNQPAVFGDPEITQIEQLYNNPAKSEKEQEIAKILNQKDWVEAEKIRLSEIKQQVSQTPLPKPELPVDIEVNISRVTQPSKLISTLGNTSKSVGRILLGGGRTALGSAGSTALRGAIGAADTTANLIRGVGSLSRLAALSNPWVLGIGGALLLLLILIILLGGLLGPLGGGQIIPGGKGRTGDLNYTIPFRDKSVSVANPSAIKAEILSNWPNAQINNWDNIVTQSIANNWNPAFVLTLWIEETGAQGVANYSDPLGCAPQQPTADINISLKCLFDNFNNFPNERFADFMCMYSESKNSPCQFITNSDFPLNIKKWYTKLVPAGPGALTELASAPVLASCPIPNGKIGCASYGPLAPWGGFVGVCAVNSSGIGGHCNSVYSNAVGICTIPIKDGNLIRTAKSIDVANNSKPGDPVLLPSIGERPINWQYIGAVGAGSNYGWIRIFHSVGAPEGIWTLHLVHVNQDEPFFPEGTIIPSGKTGATILNPWIPKDNYPHVHVTVGLNVGDSLGDLKDYSPNWKFADRDLGMCTGT